MSRSAPHLVVVLVVGLVSTALVSTAAAQKRVEVKNDSFTDRQQGQIASAEIVSGEMYLATFQIPQSWTLPVELKGVRVVAVAGKNGPANQYCGRFTIEVFKEGNNPSQQELVCPQAGSLSPMARVKPPGSTIYSMHNQFKGQTGSNQYAFQVKADNQHYQDLLFSTVNQKMGVTINPVMLNTRTVRVGIKAIDKGCPPMGGQYFPLVATDMDGTAGKNWLYGAMRSNFGGSTFTCNKTAHFRWADMASQLSTTPGDFILRLLFDRPTGGDTGVADAGMDAGMTMLDAAGGSDAVDVAADVTPADVAAVDASMNDVSADVSTSDVPPTDSAGEDSASGQPDAAPGALVVESITPSSVDAGEETDVVILGSGFRTGLEVLLGAQSIQVDEVLSERIRATVPAGIDAGTYDVVVTNPGGETELLEDGLQVVDGSQPDAATAGDTAADAGSDDTPATRSGATDGGCGCRARRAPPVSSLFWLGLTLLALAARRRK